ncbi:MAG: hypothetical protein KAI64_05335 [Thermoplasmata archaeon]|nr:hypothetical protein [Thermoplasmata archaeon]
MKRTTRYYWWADRIATLFRLLADFFERVEDYFRMKQIHIERDYCPDCGIEGGYGHRDGCGSE